MESDYENLFFNTAAAFVFKGLGCQMAGLIATRVRFHALVTLFEWCEDVFLVYLCFAAVVIYNSDV